MLLLVGLSLSSCMPSAPGDEEKESYFLAGRGHVNAMDYQGAVESFEKALEVNPKSAAAHFELGCLYYQRESDPAAAIYHFERYLKLSPNSGREEIVKGYILACKQQLAQAVSLAPGMEKQQRELEQLAEENRRLHDDVEKWRSYSLRLQGLTNQAGAGAAATRAAQPSVSGQTTPAGASPVSLTSSSSRSTALPAANPRTHTVKAGETPSIIARKYGIKVDVLLSANPRVDPRRMQVGQALIIPAP